MKDGIKDKSLKFATLIYSTISSEMAYRDPVMKQAVRSGTAIGALVCEAQDAESKKDFIHKLSIALKESNETEYWLTLITSKNNPSIDTFLKLKVECKELIYMLVRILKSTKKNLRNDK